jgi:hypothetical protein
MKNANKLRIIALTLVFLVTATVCFAQSGGRTINSATELRQYLDSQPGNTPDKPIRVSVAANGNMIGGIVKAIQDAGKYVYLTLTGSALTAIPKEGFSKCTNLAGIAIPNSVTIIGERAFYECTSLTSVTIPNSVTFIGEWAFYECTSLANVTIPNGVTGIVEGAFGNCTNLTTINVAAGNSSFSSDNGILYNKNKTDLCAFPAGKTGAFTIPDTVTRIREYAFVGCARLTSVTIPNSVTEIRWEAFLHCTSLASVTFQGRITEDNYAFNGDLWTKYLAGGPGTYTRASGGNTWTKR